MKIPLSIVNFLGKPDNYAIVDDFISRSAQPQKEDFAWLKEQGVTDVFNFRRKSPEIDFDEQSVVKKYGLRYHSIPSKTKKPTKENIYTFLKEIEDVKQRGGKAHIHCKAGADRTGMYSFIYKMVNGIDNLTYNLAEWFKRGYHYTKYPEIMEWAVNFVHKYKK